MAEASNIISVARPGIELTTDKASLTDESTRLNYEVYTDSNEYYVFDGEIGNDYINNLIYNEDIIDDLRQDGKSLMINSKNEYPNKHEGEEGGAVGEFTLHQDIEEESTLHQDTAEESTLHQDTA